VLFLILIPATLSLQPISARAQRSSQRVLGPRSTNPRVRRSCLLVGCGRPPRCPAARSLRLVSEHALHAVRAGQFLSWMLPRSVHSVDGGWVGCCQAVCQGQGVGSACWAWMFHTSPRSRGTIWARCAGPCRRRASWSLCIPRESNIGFCHPIRLVDWHAWCPVGPQVVQHPGRCGIFHVLP
jgi:hypothetical protein